MERMVNVRPSLMANLMLAIVKEVAAGFRQAQTVRTPLPSATARHLYLIGRLRRRLLCLVNVREDLKECFDASDMADRAERECQSSEGWVTFGEHRLRVNKGPCGYR